MPTKPPIHQPIPPRAARRALIDDWRGSAAARGYDRAWRKLRLIKLKLDPLCWWCAREGRIEAATVVDHIKPIATHPELRMILDNLRSGCESHHNAHTARQTAGGHRGKR